MSTITIGANNLIISLANNVGVANDAWQSQRPAQKKICLAPLVISSKWSNWPINLFQKALRKPIIALSLLSTMISGNKTNYHGSKRPG